MIRESPGEVVRRGADVACDIEDVRTCSLDRRHEDCGFAVESGAVGVVAVTLLDVRNVVDHHGCRARSHYRRSSDLIDAGVVAACADVVAVASVVEVAARYVEPVTRNGIVHLAEADAGGCHAIHVEIHVDLLVGVAPRLGAHHAGDAFEFFFEALRERAKLAVVGRVRDKCKLNDVDIRWRLLQDANLGDLVGHVALGVCRRLVDIVIRVVRIGPLQKLDVRHRDTVANC